MNRFVRTIVAAAGLLALIAPATGSAHDDENDARLRSGLSTVRCVPRTLSGHTNYFRYCIP